MFEKLTLDLLVDFVSFGQFYLQQKKREWKHRVHISTDDLNLIHEI